jgi:hypothetical protein
MIGSQTTGFRPARVVALWLLVIGPLLLGAMAPAVALAEWSRLEAHIQGAGGSGFVGLLNVSVTNHAENDAAAVTEVQFSDDGIAWYAMPYTGEAEDWVLAGESGPKSLAVRFVAADGNVSPVLRTAVTVDTRGPRTRALRHMRVPAGRTACLRFVVRDRFSPRVKARIVVRGAGVRRSYDLGTIATGKCTARVSLGLPKGSYRWSVRAIDLAGWAQTRGSSRTLTVW